jgi:hypothetical protein
MKTFSELLTEYMIRSGISDSTLAWKIKGITRQTIFHWRSGHTKRPNCKQVAKCAEVLRLTPAERIAFLSSAGCSYQYDTPAKTQHHQIREKGLTYSLFNLTENIPLIPITTRPIIHPQQFFGHHNLLKNLFDDWKRLPLENKAVIGPKLSGKTSLINYLKFIHQIPVEQLRDGQRYDWLEQEYNWISIDFKNDVRMQRLASLIPYCLKEMQLLDSNISKLDDFVNLLEDKLTKPTVILMDNIEAGLQSPELDQEFWCCMRYLGGNGIGGRIGFLITSRQSLSQLEELSAQLNKTSPFFNLFTEYPLTAFTETEARELIRFAPQPISSADTDWILTHSQYRPFYLQLLCETRLAAFKANDHSDQWQTIGLNKIALYPFNETI